MRGNDNSVPQYFGYIEGMLFIALINLRGLVIILCEIIFCICEFKFSCWCFVIKTYFVLNEIV